MKVVVVGKGGREHALAKKISESSLLTKLWVIPGNPGMELDGLVCENLQNNQQIEEFCLSHQVSLVILGPEAAILSDLKVRLQAKGISCFAPDQEVARLESSKIFCKQILKESEVPTAQLQIVHSEAEALQALKKHPFPQPIVVKADGLAQGKGVWVCDTLEKAIEAIQVMGPQFGYTFLLEECLVGPELSAFALCDGLDFVVLGTACDYKRINADPFSANTGGMGAYSPCDFLSEEDKSTIYEIFRKTLTCLHLKGLSYQGFLFAGLMKTAQGLYVLEYNVRMGDPETQALLPRLKTDLLQLIQAAVQHTLKNQLCVLQNETSVHIVATSEGYPSSPMKMGCEISLPTKEQLKSLLFYAGVKKENSKMLNFGGRVLGITALGKNKQEARDQAYHDIQKISFEGMYFRKDIGQ